MGADVDRGHSVPSHPVSERHARQRGASAVEYIGGMVVAALLVAAVVVAMGPAGADIRSAVCRSVATILQTDLGCAAGGEGEAAAPDDSDFIPEKCMVHEEGDRYSSVMKIGFVEIGENAGFIRTEYSDGTVTMTATDGGSLGATGGFGADASWGSHEAAARIDFGGGVEFDAGSTWTFESAEQADQFRDQLDDYLYDQWAMTHPACAMGTCVPRPLLGAEPPPVPSTSFAGVKVTGDVTADLGISATGPPGATQVDLETQGLAAGINPSSSWVTTSDTKGTDDTSDDTTTYVTDMQINTELTGQLTLPTGGLGTTHGVSLAITKDADGRITEVKVTTLSEVSGSQGESTDPEVSKGEGKDEKSGGVGASDETTEGDVVVSEVSLTLDPENAEDQQVVTDWLGGTGNHPWPGVLPLNALDASSADPNDPFSQLLFQQATSTSMAYDHVSDVQKFGFNLKFGLALGADFTMASEESTITEATMLGAPRADGTRPVLPYTECVG